MRFLAFCCAAGLSLAAPGAEGLFQQRIGPWGFASDKWPDVLKAIADNRPVVDEVWTVTSDRCYGDLEIHRRQAARYAAAKKDLDRLGVRLNLEIGWTIGHGDGFDTRPEFFSARTWGGFTGRSGVTCRECSCPRQPELLRYLVEMTRIYAAVGFKRIWIDDDLRVGNHKPACDWKNPSGDWGCWCDTCMAAMNREFGKAWTREGVLREMQSDPALEAELEKFQFRSLALVAKAIAETVREVSPETTMGLEHARWRNDNLGIVFKALHEGSGKPVASRCGGRGYWDRRPLDQVMKAWNVTRQLALDRKYDWITPSVPEIESYPAYFACRTPRTLVSEGLLSLGWGMDALSYYICRFTREETDWYSKHRWAPMCADAGLVRAYAGSCRATRPVGLSVETPTETALDEAEFAALGIPLISGYGRSMGGISVPKGFAMATASYEKVREIRAEAEKAANGGLPALALDPVQWVLIARENDLRELRSVLVLNASMDDSPTAGLLLKGLPEGCSRVIVWPMRGERSVLPVVRNPRGAVVMLPSLGPWLGAVVFADLP